jgi:hypothetical protein
MMMLNFMSNGKPKLLKRTYKKKSDYALNLTTNGKPRVVATMEPKVVKKTCPAGKMTNPKTGRCVKVPVKKSCPAGKMTNPKTGRCVKKPCPAGKMTNPKTGRCIHKPVKPVKKTCIAGKMINPKTGRCIKAPVTKASPAPKYMLDLLANGKPMMIKRTYKKKAPVANNWMFNYMK